MPLYNSSRSITNGPVNCAFAFVFVDHHVIELDVFVKDKLQLKAPAFVLVLSMDNLIADNLTFNLFLWHLAYLQYGSLVDRIIIAILFRNWTTQKIIRLPGILNDHFVPRDLSPQERLKVVRPLHEPGLIGMEQYSHCIG